MADLIELDLVVREKGLKTSLTTVERLERQLIKAAKAVETNRISQDRYNKILLQAKREYQALGVSSQKATSDIRKFAEANRVAITATNGQTEAIQRQNTALTKNAVAATQTKRNTNQLGVLMQQTGYQVGDFAIQVQSGTNYMVALGQQATQLIGTFAMLAKSTRMIALFSGLGIAVPILTAIGAYFVRAAESSDDATQKVKSFSDAISDSQSAIDRAKTSMDILGTQGLDTLRERYGVLTREVTDLADALADIDRKAMSLEVQGAMETLFSPEFFKQVTSELGNVGAAIVETTDEDLAYMQAQLKSFEDQVKNFPHLESNYAQVIKEMKEEIAAVTGDLENMGSLTDELKVPAESLSTFKQLRDTIEQATKEENFLAAANGISEMRALMESLGIEVDSGALANMTKLEDKLRQAVATTSDITSEAENLAFALENAARAMSALDGFGLSVEQKLAKMTASNQAIAQGLDGRIAGEIAVLRLQKDRLVSSEALDKQDRDNMAGEITRVDNLISAYEEQLKLNKDLTKTTKRSGSVTKEVMSDAEQAALAYADSLDNTVVGAVDGVSNAWADFVMRGFKDFSSFKDAIINSFKNMIVQMIAIAAKNRIMLSLGMGGVAPTAAMAGSGLLGGAGILGGGGAGIGAAVSGVGSGLSGVLSGGGLGSSFANLGGLASGAVSGFGAIGAALPAVGVVMAGAAVLKSIFGKKKPIISQESYDTIKQAAELTGQNINDLAIELNDGAGKLSRSTQSIIKSIADAAGGIEEFSKKASFFFSNFYTESERSQVLAEKATAELNKQFAELGVSVPKTHEEFRALVEAQDLATEAGREMYAGLLNVSEAFVAVKGSADAAASGVLASLEASNREKDFAEKQQQRLNEALTGRGGTADTSGMSFSERTSATNRAFLNIYVDFLKGIEEQGAELENLLGNIEGLNASFKAGETGLEDFLKQASSFADQTKEGFTNLAETTLRASTDIGLSAGGMAFSTETLSNFISGVQSRGAGAASAMGQQFAQGGAGVSRGISEAYNFFEDLSAFTSGPITRAMSALGQNLGVLKVSLSELETAETMASEALDVARQNGQMVTEAQMGYYNDLVNNLSLTQEASEVAMAEMQRLKEVSSIIPQQAAALELAILSNLSGGVVDTGRMVQLVGTYGSSLGRQIAIALANAANAGVQGVMSAFGQFSSLYSSGAITKGQYTGLTNEITGFLNAARGGGGGGGSSSPVIDKAAEALEKFKSAMESFRDGVQDSIDALKNLNGEQDELNSSRVKEFRYLQELRVINEDNLDQVKKSVSIVEDIDEGDFASGLAYRREIGKTIALLEAVKSLEGVSNGGDSVAASAVVSASPASVTSAVKSSTSQAANSNSELRREVSEMKNDLKTALIQIAKNTRKSSDTLNKFDYQGLPESRGY